jgi:hypothetical protein
MAAALRLLFVWIRFLWHVARCQVSLVPLEELLKRLLQVV